MPQLDKVTFYPIVFWTACLYLGSYFFINIFFFLNFFNKIKLSQDTYRVYILD